MFGDGSWEFGPTQSMLTPENLQRLYGTPFAEFTRDGQTLGCWGTHGREPGQMHNPWALVCDSLGRVHVLDTNNHRVQRIGL